MTLCKGNAVVKGRPLRHAQRCGAAPEYDGYCVVHLAANGYKRCEACRAWRTPQEIIERRECRHCGAGGPFRKAAAPTPTSFDPPLDARALDDEALRRGRDEAMSRRRAQSPATLPPVPCPECNSTNLRLAFVDQIDGQPTTDVYDCLDCGQHFQVPF
jgi:hypothetical protein